MESFAAFEQSLHDYLMQLHNPLFQPSDLLWSVLVGQSRRESKALQSAIIQAIEDLKPTPDVSQQARSWRHYEVLTYRYIQGLTQDTAAARMGLTPRHLRREQDRAERGLAQHLWAQRSEEHSETEAASTRAQTQSTKIAGAPATDGAPAAAGGNVETAAWRSQVRQELATLQQNVPQTKSEVAAVIAGVVKIGQVLTAKHNIQLKVDPIPKNMTAVIQPSALRQILLTAIEKLVQHMTSGEIVLLAEIAGDIITLTVTGGPTVAGVLPDSDLIQMLLADLGSALHIYRSGETIVFQITLPATAGAADTQTVSVLAVDDNADLVTFYQLYTANTRYQITHLADAQHLFDTITTGKPDIIVLDVLLPDMDGWELLTYLHEHPDTKAIPVIICSVIRREDLALALGAALYLPKPVRRREFVEALDEVYGRVAAT